jgi:DNA-binding response OmpR family regulator
MSNVLVIDDDPAIVRLVLVALLSAGIEGVAAYSGAEGMAYLQDGHAPPGLILLDLSMPEMDGRDFFNLARGGGYAGPIVFFSAVGAARANQEMGGQGAIEKPFDPDDLIAEVRRHLGPQA